MRHIVLAAPICALLALPAAAQEEVPDTDGFPELEEGLAVLGQGLGLLLEGLGDEMSPALEALEERAREMAPALGQLRELVGTLDNYERPHILPNGDIIIRRKNPIIAAPDELEL